MATITFDTLKFSKRLKEAGVPEKQAEAEAEALSEVLQINLQELATLADLRHLEERMESRLIQMEQRIVIKLGVLMAASIGIVAALVRLL